MGIGVFFFSILILFLYLPLSVRMNRSGRHLQDVRAFKPSLDLSKCLDKHSSLITELLYSIL